MSRLATAFLMSLALVAPGFALAAEPAAAPAPVSAAAT